MFQLTEIPPDSVQQIVLNRKRSSRGTAVLCLLRLVLIQNLLQFLNRRAQLAQVRQIDTPQGSCDFARNRVDFVVPFLESEVHFADVLGLLFLVVRCFLGGSGLFGFACVAGVALQW